jgi:uncharacterized membrane protein YgdD (TMEM256/DUF423 family)
VRHIKQDRYLTALGAAAAFLAVALGAFGTHGLRDRLSSEMLAIWHTGVEYHFGHALAAILAGIASSMYRSHLIRLAGWLFLAGILVFSGSLYALSVTGEKMLGAVTPLGGLCFLGGWCMFALGAYQEPKKDANEEP